MAAKFELTKNYRFTKQELLDKTKLALEKCKIKILNIDEEAGLINAKTKITIWSFKENIDIQINDDGAVKIKSECALPTQIIAWGKNKRNVNKLFSNLDT